LRRENHREGKTVEKKPETSNRDARGNKTVGGGGEMRSSERVKAKRKKKMGHLKVSSRQKGS